MMCTISIRQKFAEIAFDWEKKNELNLKSQGRQKKTLPRKADGDTVPLLRDTITLMPVSTKGTEKSMTSDLSSLMVNDPTAIAAFL